MKIYLASPFFSAKQIELVRKLESLLESLGNSVYSPCRDGVVLNRKSTQGEKIRTFGENIGCISWSDCVVAVIDDFDKGVIFEMGYAKGIGKPIIAYTNEKYGMNVMLSEAVKSFVQGEKELADVFRTGKVNSWKGDIQ